MIAKSFVGYIAKISNLANEFEQGKVMGVSGSLLAFTWAVGPIISGISNVESITFCYFFSIIMLIIGLLILSFAEIINRIIQNQNSIIH